MHKISELPSNGLQKKIRKQRRASKPKTRSGCATCKAKHVKCDEVKPFCLRCISRGLRCPGYNSPVSSREVSLPSSPGSQSDGSLASPSYQLPLCGFRGAKDSRAFEFFYCKASPVLSGYFFGKLWGQTLFQISVQDETLRSATIALSSIVENECMIAKANELNLHTEREYAIESYNLAIQHLVAYLDDPGSKVLVVLMTCIIFVCVDFLRHDVKAARTHIQGGLKLLETIRKNPALLPNSQQSLFEEVLIPTLSWLNMCFSIFGGEVFSVKYLRGLSEQPSMPKKQENVEQTISQFVDIASTMINFAREHAHSRYASERDPNIYAKLLQVLESLEQWRVTCDFSLNTNLSKRSNIHNHDLDPGTGLLRAHYLALKTWFEVLLAPSEMIWDLYKAEFEEMLFLASQAINDSMRFPDAFSRCFAFEMPIIPILQLVAGKCRYPSIRRQALDLLLRGPEQESMFCAQNSYTLSKKMMEIEEEGIEYSKRGAGDDESLPSEAKRIWKVDIPPIAITERGRVVNFLTKPCGPQGSWNIITEYIHINNLQLLRWGWDKQSCEETQMHAEISALNLFIP
jgi:Fungal Zn(2)-Cys(6) binuclear cluster domain/Fungal specific transcription factor domain